MARVISGTVGQYSFSMRRVIEHAMRRAGLQPENASSEQLDVARDLIFSLTSEWINAGYPLWTREWNALGCPLGGTDVPCLAGTNDVFHIYWRIFNPYRGPATLTNGQSGTVLFGGATNSDVTIPGPNPGIYVAFGGAQEVDTIGVLGGGTSSYSAALQMQTSQDGNTWTTVETLPTLNFAPGQWTYFDLNPVVTAPYVQLINPQSGSWTVNQFQFGLAEGEDIEVGPLNLDDYYNLPNKMFQDDRVDSAFLDRQLNVPVVKIWPTLNPTGFYNGTIVVVCRRYIADPGALTDKVEVPQRWLEALIWRLAAKLMYEFPGFIQNMTQSPFGITAQLQRMNMVEQMAAKAESLAWAEERTRAPLRVAPNVHCYTR